MKLLLFIHSLNSGGAERVTANLANYWAENGWQVTVVTLTSTAADFYQLNPTVQRIGLDVAGHSHHSLSGVYNNLRRIMAVRRTVLQIKPDVALAMMSTANLLLAFATVGVKGLITVGSERVHPPRIPLGFAKEALRSLLYRRLNALVALSCESATWLRLHTRARRIQVIPNAVQWPLALQEPQLTPPVRVEGRRMLLAVGRLDWQKGFDLLIQTYQRLIDDFSCWHLVILGEGPERSALEQQIKAAGLAGRVSLPGRAGNIGHWYEAADLYVMSSRFEGFPNTLIEAMAHGLPVASFDCDTGPRDIIRSEVDGLLVPAEDVNALEVALRRLMRSESLRRQMGAAAIEVQKRFSLEHIAASWAQLFEEVSSEQT